MADLNQIAESLSQLTVMQAAELVKMLETKWGVSAAAPVAMAAAPAAGGGVMSVAEELNEAQRVANGLPPLLKEYSEKLGEMSTHDRELQDRSFELKASRPPGPTAVTSPWEGFSFAVSGMMMPPAVFSSASMRLTTTRS